MTDNERAEFLRLLADISSENAGVNMAMSAALRGVLRACSGAPGLFEHVQHYLEAEYATQLATGTNATVLASFEAQRSALLSALQAPPAGST